MTININIDINIIKYLLKKSRNRNNSHRFQVCLSSFIFLLYCYHYLHFALHYSVPGTRRLLHYSVPGTRRLLHFYWCSCYLIFSFLCNVLQIVVCLFSLGHCIVCPSEDLPLLITPLVSSNFSYLYNKGIYQQFIGAPFLYRQM